MDKCFVYWKQKVSFLNSLQAFYAISSVSAVCVFPNLSTTRLLLPDLFQAMKTKAGINRFVIFLSEMSVVDEAEFWFATRSVSMSRVVM